MPIIQLQTVIKAPADLCFDLSRSIDLHMISTRKTGEHVIAGRKSGLIGLHETVTWKAKHLGIWQTLSSEITEYEKPRYFTDEMVKGIFKSFRHEHRFSEANGATTMKDIFEFKSPLGILGSIADAFFLKRYLTGFLMERNLLIKEYAETEKWKELLISGPRNIL